MSTSKNELISAEHPTTVSEVILTEDCQDAETTISVPQPQDPPPFETVNAHPPPTQTPGSVVMLSMEESMNEIPVSALGAYLISESHSGFLTEMVM